MSDIKICRETLNKFASQQSFIGDKAYLGESQITTPSKKPKNGELAKSQKSENRISSVRVFVEHSIRIVKIFKIIQERFRLNKSRYHSIILTVCGLVRLRIGSLILEVVKSDKLGQVIDVAMSYSFTPKLDLES